MRMATKMSHVRALTLAVAGALVACPSALPPTLDPESASVTKIDTRGLYFDVEFAVTNPNSVDLRLSELTAHVSLDKTIDLGSVSMSINIELPANSPQHLSVPLSVKWADVGTLAVLAARKNEIPFAVDGVTLVRGGAFPVSIRTPFHVEGVVPRAQIVDAALRYVPTFAP